MLFSSQSCTLITVFITQIYIHNIYTDNPVEVRKISKFFDNFFFIKIPSSRDSNVSEKTETKTRMGLQKFI